MIIDFSNVSRKLALLTLEQERLEALIDDAGDHKAVSYDSETGYSVCGSRTVLSGAGVPSATTIPGQKGIPAFVGQLYVNTSVSSGGLWYGANTDSVSGWRQA